MRPTKILAVFSFVWLAIASSVAQKADAAKQTELPPSIPIFSLTELSAKLPAPRPDDVKSPDAIIRAAYDVISGPAGSRDWSRFRSLFIPQARFTEVGVSPDQGPFVISWNEDEFIRDATTVFAKDPFYENGIVNRPQGYGRMTQVLSSYESHRKPGDKPFERGVNSFQLLFDGARWWIVSIFWDSERPGNPLPDDLSHN